MTCETSDAILCSAPGTGAPGVHETRAVLCEGCEGVAGDLVHDRDCLMVDMPSSYWRKFIGRVPSSLHMDRTSLRL